MRRSAIVLCVVAAGVALGAYSLAVAGDDPVYSFAGTSAARGVALLAAGWALIGCGTVFWARTPGSQFGPLLAGGGFGWLAIELNNPGIGSALAFTLGLVFYGLLCTALIGHAVLVYPRARLASLPERATVLAAYAGSLLMLGLLPALFFDPRAQGCSQCPHNLLLVSNRADVVDSLNRVGVYLGLGWTLTLAILATAKLRRVSPAARLVIVAGVAYLTLTASEFAASLDRGFLDNEPLERKLWVGQAVALIGIAIGVSWSWLRGRRARSAVARLIVELGKAPPPGGLREILADIVGDPELVLAYPLDGSERLVDAAGRPVDLANCEQRTSLVQKGRAVAVLGHAPGLLDDEQLVDEVTAAAQLALENEQLQAEVRAQLEDLRSSRARIVEASDAERTRLERDLHDGAQQRLVAFALSLRLLRTQLDSSANPLVGQRLGRAEEALDSAISELRELAHGIYPAVLADGGLAVAVQALAESGEAPIHIERLPEGRYPGQVETAAYTVVAEAVRSASGPLRVRGECTGGTLVIDVNMRGDTSVDLSELEDRIGALDGRLHVERDIDGETRIRAELPCAS